MTVEPRTPEREDKFLEALAGTCNVTRACELSGVPRQTVYGWRQQDPLFATRWDEAKRIGVEALEDEAIRRAHEGIVEEHFKDGQLVGMTRKYSDTLMIFLLKGAKPETYRERSSTEISGPNGGPIQFDNPQDEFAKLTAQLGQRLDKGEDLA